MTDKSHKRPIRSFVLRQGRLTPSQKQALESGWPKYGIDVTDQPLDLVALFGRDAPRILEIGFGNGESLADMAAAHPERDYIGIEVHGPGVGRLLARMQKDGINNIRIARDDAVEVLKQAIPENSLDGLQLFFPDPWHKKKHHKRRIVQPDFIELVASRLKQGGILHMATDWQDYADHMIEIMAESPLFENLAGEALYSDRGERPQTKYETRGERLGHAVRDLKFRKSG